MKQLVYEVLWKYVDKTAPYAEIYSDGSFLYTLETWTREWWQRDKKGSEEERLQVNEKKRELWTNEWNWRLNHTGYCPTAWGNRKYPAAFDTLRYLFCEDKGMNEPRFAKNIVVKYHGDGKPWEKFIDDEEWDF